MQLTTHYPIFKYFAGIFLLIAPILTCNAQINPNRSIDIINQIGKELSGYDCYPEKEHKKFISISCNKDELIVKETIGLHDMPVTTDIYKMAFKDISLRFPLNIQSHNYKEVFKWFKVDEKGSDTLLNSYTDMVYLNLLPSFQPKEIAEKHNHWGQILSRNILYLSYSQTLGKPSHGQLDSIYAVVRDDHKIRLDFAKCIGGKPYNQLDSLPTLNQTTEINAAINSLVMQKFYTELKAETEGMPLDIYFQITPNGNATNIYTNQKVFWFYDFLDDQKNRFEIMNQGGSTSFFAKLQKSIGFTKVETLNAITDLIQNLNFTPGMINNKKVATVHKITIR